MLHYSQKIWRKASQKLFSEWNNIYFKKVPKKLSKTHGFDVTHMKKERQFIYFEEVSESNSTTNHSFGACIWKYYFDFLLDWDKNIYEVRIFFSWYFTE